MTAYKTHLLRELKAKKAKFGFEGSLGTHTFMALSALLQVALRGAVPNVDFKLDSNSYGSHTDIKIYTDHANLAERIRALDTLPVPDMVTLSKGKNPYDEHEQRLLASGNTLTP